MLSGVGDRDELQKNNITPKHHLPGVGKNLQEHVDALVVRNAVRGKKGPPAMTPRNLVKEIPGALSYPITGRGILAGTPVETGGFFSATDDKEVPDLQWVFLPVKLNDHGRDKNIIRSHGYSAHVVLLRPKSRGQVSLYSADPLAAPKIQLNMLSHPDDVKELIAGVKKTRALLSSAVFSEYMADELFPGEGCQSDEAIEEWLRRSANHVYHPVGTCRMGVDDMAVVDPQLRVHGLQNLRVVDASVMPSLIGGNTNAPTYMIAEKAADMILQNHAEEMS
jgi:choline dehydrogenase-like flavoprotein